MHLENAYKYKPGQSRLLLDDDRYQFEGSQNGLARLLRLQAPVEKLQGFINELIVVRGLRALMIPGDLRASGIITFFPAKEKQEAIVIDLRSPAQQAA